MNIILKNPDSSVGIVTLTPSAELMIAEAVSYQPLVERRVDISVRIAVLRSLTQAFEARAAEIDAELRAAIEPINAALAASLAALDPDSPTRSADAKAVEDAAIAAAQPFMDKRNAQLNAALLEIGAAQTELSELEQQAQKIEFYDYVKSSIGITAQEHGIILKLRAQRDLDERKIEHRPKVLDQEIVATDVDLPADDTFRGAFVWVEAGRIDIDMQRARAIAQDRVREVRAPKLAALDVEFMRAVESGDSAKQAQVAAQKQRLRDATADPRLLSASSPEALKAAMDAVRGEL